ncbi:transcriptional regulator Spx [Salinibacillus aidingensis]|uniref:Transcriptional regulator Spx n=1 Tax=Salinibacillus aidingensis TaxID=237684 RepID=A0ABN1BFW3_9BACI
MTVTIYGIGCKSTRKARKWLEQNEIAFVERNILHKPLTVSEIHNILRMSEDGTDGIMATRSKAYKDLNLNLDELSLQELIELIHRQPKLLKSPIIVDEKRLQAGYSDEGIRQFLPRNSRLNWRMSRLNLLNVNPTN